MKENKIMREEIQSWPWKSFLLLGFNLQHMIVNDWDRDHDYAVGEWSPREGCQERISGPALAVRKECWSTARQAGRSFPFNNSPPLDQLCQKKWNMSWSAKGSLKLKVFDDSLKNSWLKIGNLSKNSGIVRPFKKKERVPVTDKHSRWNGQQSLLINRLRINPVKISFKSWINLGLNLWPIV